MLILPDSLVVPGHEGGSDDVVLPGWVGAEADHDSDQPSCEEEARGKVHVVDGGHHPGAVICLHAKRSLCVPDADSSLFSTFSHLVREVECHSGQAHAEAIHQPEKSTLVECYEWMRRKHTFSLILVDRIAMR